MALSTGSSWNEKHRGTNAIGTALVEASSVEINGGEHFLERNDFLTCAAAPIMAANGELVGLIDISGDQRSRHPHTLGLVSMAARMIENRMVMASCNRHILLHLHAHSEGIGSVAEGIIAISDDGWILGANRTGLAMLHLTPADLSETPLTRCMDVRLDELLSRHERRPGHPHASTFARRHRAFCAGASPREFGDRQETAGQFGNFAGGCAGQPGHGRHALA